MIESPGNSSKVKKFYHFSYLMTLRYRSYVTYGVRAKVKTLGLNGLIDMQVCCELTM